MTKSFLKKHYTIIKIIELFFDLFFVVFSFLLVVQIREIIDNGNIIDAVVNLFTHFFDTYINVLTTQILYIVIVLMFFIIYKASTTRKSYIEAMKSVILALVVSNIVIILMAVLLGKTLVSPDIVMYTFLSQILVFAGYKYLFNKIISSINKRSVLIIGPTEEARTIATKFLLEKEQNRYLKYVLFEEEMDNDKLIGYINQVDDVVILQGLSEYNKNNIMSYCLSKKYTDVYLVPKLYEINIVNSKNDQIRDTPVFVSQSLHLSLTQRFLKRLLDIIVSLIAFIVALPVFIIVPILIKAHDRGPVFYKQERVTRNDKNFMLYKFRTMIVDAEKATGAVWQMENDPRITRVGKFLRATRLDELPQLLNVIKGEMSLIGPRPEREIFVKEFIKSIPDFRYRVNVKPGITGLAQVLGKYNSEPDDKLRFDLIYIRNYSIWLDIKILFLTIRAIFDRDSSATLGIPKLEDITRDLNLTLQEIDMGYLVNKEIKL